MAAVPVPEGVVTVTSTTPALWAGVLTTMDVSLATVKLAAGLPPNATAVAPVKLVPVNVTVVPPLVTPLAGATLLTAGTAGTAVTVGVNAASHEVTTASPARKERMRRGTENSNEGYMKKGAAKWETEPDRIG